MLISASRKLLFVHVQKTGGETIAKLLREQLPDVRPLGAKHGFAADAMTEVPDWNGYYKFAFVRNPWDRLVSWYVMIRDARKIGWFEAWRDPRKRSHRRQTRTNRLWRYMVENSSSFEEFVRNCTEPVEVQRGVCYSFAFNQLDYITDGAGTLLVDFVGRYENFEDDLRAALRRVGVELTSIPRENASTHAHYSTYYTDGTKELAARRFERDIRFFGYTFERVK